MTKRILIVDDEPQLLYSIKEYLARVGYDAVPAASGVQALDLLMQSPPDLILSDIMMDEMDGFEFQHRVNALTGDSIPFIFLTAKGDLQDRLAGLHGGADDYVIKPFDPEELAARIDAVLARVERTRSEERREMDSMRSRILSEVSRELRTPVGSLAARLNLVNASGFSSERKSAEHLQGALDDVNALRTLVCDLSWAAAGSTQTLALKREPVRVAPVVRGAAAKAARLASDRDIQLSISCGGLLTANLDSGAMGRALAGLLESAVQCSQESSEVRITATRSREGGVEFVIMDGGCDPHNRHPEEDTESDSLDFARRVVRGHGGQFSVTSEHDGKHSIRIWVPGRVAKHIGKRD
ncbi:MAG: hybrid sensor histidine kinase/response regulator [Anaerolineae bacterium]